MAQTENGVGISWKLNDGTMIWARRDDWAELLQDVKVIKGEAYVETLRDALKGGGAAPARTSTGPVATPVSVQAAPSTPPTSDSLTPEQAAAELGGELSGQTFQVCPACGQTKDRWIKPGVSKKTGKAYKGFYGCPTPGCPGR